MRPSGYIRGCLTRSAAGIEERSGHIIKHAPDMGINFFDTANGYSAGTSEEYPGKAVKGRKTLCAAR